jgi:hypothetical protein
VLTGSNLVDPSRNGQLPFTICSPHLMPLYEGAELIRITCPLFPIYIGARRRLLVSVFAIPHGAERKSLGDRSEERAAKRSW